MSAAWPTTPPPPPPLSCSPARVGWRCRPKFRTEPPTHPHCSLAVSALVGSAACLPAWLCKQMYHISTDMRSTQGDIFQHTSKLLSHACLEFPTLFFIRLDRSWAVSVTASSTKSGRRQFAPTLSRVNYTAFLHFTLFLSKLRLESRSFLNAAELKLLWSSDH